MTARLVVVLAVTSRAASQHGTGAVRVLHGKGTPWQLHDINSVFQVKYDVELGGGRNPTWAPSNLTYRLPNTSETLSGPPFFPTLPAHMFGKPSQAHKKTSPGKRDALAQNGPSTQKRGTLATLSRRPSPLTIFVTIGRGVAICLCIGILLAYGFCQKTSQRNLKDQEQSTHGPSRLGKSSGKDHPPLCEEECCTRPPSMQWVDCQLFVDIVTARKDLTNASLHRSTLAVGDAIIGAAALLHQEPEAGEDDKVIQEMRMRLNEIPNWTSLPSLLKLAMRDALRSSTVLSSALQEVVPDNHTAVLEAALCLVFDDGAPPAPLVAVEAKRSDEGLVDGDAN